MLSTIKNRRIHKSLDVAKIIIIVILGTAIKHLDANYATSDNSFSSAEKNNNNNVAGQATMANLLLAPAYNSGTNKTIELALEQLAPDLRQLRDFTLPTSGNKAHDDAKSLELSLEAWKLMRNQAHRAVNSRLQMVEPILIEFLNEARVRRQCLLACERTLHAARSLESWAIQRKWHKEQIGQFY